MVRRKLLITTIGVAVFLPFLPLLLWSIAGSWYAPDLLPQQFSLRAIRYLAGTTGSQVLHALTSSFLLAVTVSLFSLLLGIPAGRALGISTFSGKKLVGLLLALPVIVPPLSVSMGLHLWFLQLNLTETSAGIVLIHLTFCLPYTIFVLWGVFSDYDADMEEQARSLGASTMEIYFRVMLPMILPGVCVAALFSFLLSWSQYLSTLIIGGGKVLSLPILLFSLMDGGDRPVAAAVSLLFILPALAAPVFGAHALGKNAVRGVR